MSNIKINFSHVSLNDPAHLIFERDRLMPQSIETFSIRMFQEVFEKIKKVIAKRYGIATIVGPMRGGFSGDLNGVEIFINENIGWEHRLFNLLHLFGHTIQWAVRKDGYDLGYKLFNKPDQDLLVRLLQYEREAARYSAALLRQTNNEESLPWLSTYSDADVRFLEHYYKTGEIRYLHEFRRTGVANIRPLCVPQFSPIKKARRADGIVVFAKYSGGGSA